MFRSKVSSMLRGNFKNISDGVRNTNLFQYRLFSNAIVPNNDVPAKDEELPDKLYKKIEIEVRGNDPAVLKSYGDYAVMAANHLNIIVGRNMAPYKAVHERYTVLKSVHIYKKHRVQYEHRTYYRFLDFLKLTGSTADTFLEYIQRNLPEGVAMKVTKVELQRLPTSVQQVPLEI